MPMQHPSIGSVSALAPTAAVAEAGGQISGQATSCPGALDDARRDRQPCSRAVVAAEAGLDPDMSCRSALAAARLPCGSFRAARAGPSPWHSRSPGPPAGPLSYPEPKISSHDTALRPCRPAGHSL